MMGGGGGGGEREREINICENMRKLGIWKME